MFEATLLFFFTALAYSLPTNQTMYDDDDDFPNGNSTHLTPAGEAFLFGMAILILGCLVFFTAAALWVCVYRKNGYQVIG